MSRFGHLRQVQKGDRDAFVPVTLHNYSPPRRRGFVPDGLYAADVADADWRPSEKGNGVNLNMLLRIALPQEYKGIEIADRIYVPFDDQIETMPEGPDKDKTIQSVEIGYSKLQHMLRSIASETPGKFEALQQVGPDGRPQEARVGPSSIMNKRVFFETERGKDGVMGRDGKIRNFGNTSEVRWYVGSEDFAKTPGPAPQPTSGTEQKEKPELRSVGGAVAGNGTQPVATQAQPQPKVGALVDF